MIRAVVIVCLIAVSAIAMGQEYENGIDQLHNSSYLLSRYFAMRNNGSNVYSEDSAAVTGIVSGVYAIGYTNGVVGNGLYTGTNGVMLFTAPQFGTGDYTISVWARIPNGQSAVRPVVSTNTIASSPSTPFQYPMITVYTNGSVYIQRNARGAYYSSVTGQLSGWHHIVVKRTSGVVSLLIDGQNTPLFPSGTDYDQNGYSFSGTACYVAKFVYDGTTYFYPGEYDELRMYTRSISDSEARLLYRMAATIYQNR